MTDGEESFRHLTRITERTENTGTVWNVQCPAYCCPHTRTYALTTPHQTDVQTHTHIHTHTHTLTHTHIHTHTHTHSHTHIHTHTLTHTHTHKKNPSLVGLELVTSELVAQLVA